MRILIVDDHRLFIDGLRLILDKLDPDAQIIESTTAHGAIDLLEAGEEFDLILMDLQMPDLGGLSILQRMQERGAWLPIVVVSAEESLHVIRAALEAGALGFIPKSQSSQQMLSALTRILEGDIFVPADIEKALERPARKSANVSGITRRQHDVLRLLAEGYSNRQIATTLVLSEHTVKAHVSALLVALGACNRTDCVRVARQRGMLEGA
jgi:DNA-binding NarL/FixJ family response regulator